MLRHMLRDVLCYLFLGWGRSFLNGIFLLIRFPYSLVLLDIPSSEGLGVILLGVFVRGFSNYDAYSTC